MQVSLIRAGCAVRQLAVTDSTADCPKQAGASPSHAFEKAAAIDAVVFEILDSTLCHIPADESRCPAGPIFFGEPSHASTGSSARDCPPETVVRADCPSRKLHLPGWDPAGEFCRRSSWAGCFRLSRNNSR